MAINEYLPVFKPGTAITMTTKAAVTGGRLVEITSDGTIQHAGANSTAVVGVAAWDATAGSQVTVHSGGVQEVPASASVNAGQRVAATADGKAGPWDGSTAGADIGVALTTSTGSDAPVRVKATI